MYDTIALPEEVIANLGAESRDFAVRANRSQPIKNSLSLLAFGIFWLAFTSIFVVAFLGPLFQGNEVHFTADNVPVVAGPGNLRAIIVPAMVFGLFVFIGIGMVGFGIMNLLKKGGYFIGTPARLVNYHRGTIRSIDWELFSGDISTSGNPLKGNISLGMRTGKMVSRKNGPDRYVPDILYITGIPDVFEIEQKCRKRIKENDPTPAAI